MEEMDLKNTYFTSELVALGLTDKESLVYLYLLERGADVGGTKIAIGTKLHRQHVYSALAMLGEKQLVQKIPHGKQFRYRASAPDAVEKMTRRHHVRAGLLAEELKRISPLGHDQNFEVLVGETAIRQHQMDFVRGAEDGETQHIIGGSAPAFIELIGEDYTEMLRVQKSKNFTTHYIGHKREGEALQPYEASHINFQAKLLTEMPEGLPQFTVRRNTLEFYAISGSPQILYIIRSKQVAESYRAFFMMLWNMIPESA